MIHELMNSRIRRILYLTLALAPLALVSCDGVGRVDRKVSKVVVPDTPTILAEAEDAPAGTAYVVPVPESEIVVRRTVYVPIYSHIYISDSLRPYGLAASLSVRNTDPTHPIVLHSLRYYDTAGELVRNELKAPLRIDPMASVDTFVAPSDKSGGLGANFLVEWVATAEVNEPIIQAVMIGTAGGQGISFVTDGQPIEHSPPPPKDEPDIASKNEDAPPDNAPKPSP